MQTRPLEGVPLCFFIEDGVQFLLTAVIMNITYMNLAASEQMRLVILKIICKAKNKQIDYVAPTAYYCKYYSYDN